MFIVFLPQTLWKGSLSALPAVGAAGSGIRLGNESASIQAPFCRFQEHGTTWDHSCSPRSSSSPPVHLTFAGGIQRPLSSCTNHQQLPAHPGSSECCSPTYDNTFDIFIAFLTFILFPFFFALPQENEHLQKFQVTWELHNKHLFENLVFSEPILRSSLPALIAQLR